MEFTTLTNEEFLSFLKDHPLETFFQDPRMAEIDAMKGWKTILLGVKENNKVIAGARIMYTTVRFKKKLYYCPRGPILDYHNKQLLAFFINNLKNYIKKANGYTLHIDPPLMYKERDINGDEIPDGINNDIVVKDLKKLGFKHDGFIRHYDVTKQVRWSFELPLNDKDESTLLKEMNGNTRRSIQKAEHYKVKVRELSKEEIPIFKEICDVTSERRKFLERPLAYYYKMYDLFHDKGEIAYMVAEVDLNETLKVLDNDLMDLDKTRENLLKHNKAGQLKEIESQINDLNKKINEFKAIKDEKGNHIYLAGAMFMIYGHDIMYYHAGGYKEYMAFFGQYLIQWEMIKKALEMKKACYNFYGIKGVFDKQDPDYGVYLFKKGFNGHVIEYIGDFYLPISPYYYIQNLRKKMKK